MWGYQTLCIHTYSKATTSWEILRCKPAQLGYKTCFGRPCHWCCCISRTSIFVTQPLCTSGKITSSCVSGFENIDCNCIFGNFPRSRICFQRGEIRNFSAANFQLKFHCWLWNLGAFLSRKIALDNFMAYLKSGT